MCGITGFAGVRADASILMSMMRIITHRGPDEDGYSIHEDIGIGMRRLSIVDLAGGAQPMHSDDGALSIVFNGEIYNYRELAEELESQGYRLRTKSDTEVVLALFTRWQENCLEKLRGMFAFAILDRRDRSLFIARDRTGIKPLYYWTSGKACVFGSEIKSLLASGQFRAEADIPSINHYLALRYVPGPESLFKGIKRLLPGHWMRWRDGVIQMTRYWQPEIREKAQLSDAEFQERFDYLFEESINLHRMGDVPHGAYLSAGLDSTAVVSALSKRSETKIKTFTVGYGWQGDELAAARETADQLGTEHHEIICSSSDFEHLPRIIWHSDEPLGDPIVLPTYMLAHTASKHVKIVLTGEGADEILAGYLFHKAVKIAALYRRLIPDPIHSHIVNPLLRALPVGLLNRGFNYPGYLGENGKRRLLAFLALSRNQSPSQLLQFFITLFPDNERNHLLMPEFQLPSDTKNINWPEYTEGSVLDKTLRMQYVDWLPDNILMRQDKMSMAHGLEARVPFLDHRLIEFMETVPDHLKLTLSRNKVLLRNYVEKNGIKNVARRKKNPFYFPMEEYFDGSAFQDILSSTLGEKPLRDRGLFNPAIVQSLIYGMKQKDFLAAKQLFALISLELWFQVFIDKKYTF